MNDLVISEDDIKSDIKHKNYNTFAVSFELTADTELKAVHEKAKMLLNSCIYEMAAAYELLPKGCYDSIISNIIYLGLSEQQQIINKGKK
jgi:hypothetical protein